MPVAAQIPLVIGLVLVWIAMIYGMEKMFMRTDRRMQMREAQRMTERAGGTAASESL